MKFVKATLLVAVLSASFIVSPAQDKMYLTTGNKPGKLVEMTPSVITYTAPDGKKKNTIPTVTAIVMFNSKGGFIVPSKMDFNLDKTWQQIQQFTNGETGSSSADRIYTTDKKIFRGNITDENAESLNMSADNSVSNLSKKNIAVVIYKDGHHVMYSQPSAAADILLTSVPAPATPAKLPVAASEPAKPQQDVAVKKVVTPATETAKETVNTQPDMTAKKAASVSTTQPAQAPVASAVSTPAQTTPPLTVEDLAPNINKTEFERKALEKTTQLTFYLKTIYQRIATTDEKNKAITQALTLFVNEDALVWVSSLNNAEKKYSIRSYLNHIKLIPYDKVEIEWNKVQYASNLKLGADGNYYGTVSFEQVFRGYVDGNVVYKDVTRKDVTVVLKSLEKNVNGKPVNTWDVLLSDIGVASTKSLIE